MTQEGFKRKLTAILSADVEGYSRLMDLDEETTIQTLTAYREALSNLIQSYRGRVVDATGDNLLAEFASAVDAANCAEMWLKREIEFMVMGSILPLECKAWLRREVFAYPEVYMIILRTS
jgi:class 3 adenylate cyclase